MTYLFNDGQESPDCRQRNVPTGTFLFTYGTLRPGGALDSFTPGRHVGTAVIAGKLYRHHRAHYPVFRDALTAATDAVVVGDVFAIDRPSDLDDVIDMECGAGYDARIRRVTIRTHHPFANMTSGDRVHVIVFAWPERFPVGPRIYCGDWLSPEAADVCNDLDRGAGFTSRR